MRIFPLCIVAFLLVGCGQKGPLYLPEQTANEEVQHG